MQILLAHNRYKQRGGEDMVVAAEAALLRRYGHEVYEFTKDNNDIEGRGHLGLFRDTVWSRQSHREITELIRTKQPDVVHFHNTLPLISPAAIHAAKALGVATVQTLHNYRLVCPNGQLFRSGRPCEDCVGKRVAWPGVLHACYRVSRPATAAVAAMIATHRHMRTWTEKIDLHIALTEFGRRKFIEVGLPGDRIMVKPNFLAHDPGKGNGGGRFALFAGRLSAEKGIRTLLAAWRQVGNRLPLRIVGDGPLGDLVAAAASRIDGVTWLGERPHDKVLELMGEAAMLVMPSEWYEPFGLTIIEAFAKGTPVIGASIGSIGTMIEDGRNGHLFRPAEPADLAAKVLGFLANPGAPATMRQAARRSFEEHYTAERNYGRLMEIYAVAIERNVR